MKDGQLYWIKLLNAKFSINHYGTSRPTEVTSIAVMEVTPNSPNSSTLGKVIKQITVPHILYKDSSMRGKGFKHFLFQENTPFLQRIPSSLTSPSEDFWPVSTGPLWFSVLCITGYSPKIIARVLSTHWYSRNHQIALWKLRGKRDFPTFCFKTNPLVRYSLTSFP